MCYTYILRCLGDNSYYVGSTRNIRNRLMAHTKGGVKFTKSRLPVKLIFLKKFGDYIEAWKFEVKIKSWKKRKSIERMLNKPDNIAGEHCRVV